MMKSEKMKDRTDFSHAEKQLVEPTPESVDTVLRPYMSELRDVLKHHQAPFAVEQALLAQFKQQHRPQPWYKKLGEMYWQMASAVAVAVLALSVTVQTTRLEQDWTASQTQMMAESSLHEEIPFVALGSGEEIVMQDNMRIVQAEVPHTMLASMGISVSADQIGGSSTAEMLYGANNQPLAVRFVPPSLK